jgi:hypothetical protein
MDAAMMQLTTLVLWMQIGATEPTSVALPRATAVAMAKRLLESEPFVGSTEDRSSKEVGRFFSRTELSLLRGNPLVGHWHSSSFRWESAKEVAWGGIKSAHRSCGAIQGKAWAAAFRSAAANTGLVVTPKGAVEVSGGCVGAVIDPSSAEPVPGVLLELRVKSPGGTLLYRLGMGKPTVEEAMGAALEFVLRFSQALPLEDPK